jgi:uncharacterized protein with GYD domain
MVADEVKEKGEGIFMLFMYIHTHTVENCMAGKPQELEKITNEVLDAFKKAGIKVLGAYSAPHEHTGFRIIEANDMAVLQRALLPMTKWGTARLVPVTLNEAWTK